MKAPFELRFRHSNRDRTTVSTDAEVHFVEGLEQLAHFKFIESLVGLYGVVTGHCGHHMLLDVSPGKTALPDRQAVRDIVQELFHLHLGKQRGTLDRKGSSTIGLHLELEFLQDLEVVFEDFGFVERQVNNSGSEQPLGTSEVLAGMLHEVMEHHPLMRSMLINQNQLTAPSQRR